MNRTFNGLSGREAFFECSELEFPIGFFGATTAARSARTARRKPVSPPEGPTAADEDVVAALQRSARQAAQAGTGAGRPHR